MLVAYQVALEVIVELRNVVEQIKIYDVDVAKQLRRAASNTVHNLAEGQRKHGGDKRHAYEIAHGEAREVLGALDVAAAWGWKIDDAAARAKLDRLLGLCWGLTHGRARRSES